MSYIVTNKIMSVFMSNCVQSATKQIKLIYWLAADSSFTPEIRYKEVLSWPNNSHFWKMQIRHDFKTMLTDFIDFSEKFLQLFFLSCWFFLHFDATDSREN